MIKSAYADVTIQDRGFMKHIHHVMVDLGVYPNDPSSRLVELYKVVLRENVNASGSGGGKPRNIELYRKVLGPQQDPSTGLWMRIGNWKELEEYDDASASGSVAVDPLTGDVHVMLVFGKTVNGFLRFQDWEQTIPRSVFAPAIVRPTLTGVQGPKGDKGDQGVQGIPGPQGLPGKDGSGGALDPNDRAALDWLKTFRAMIKVLFSM